MKKKVMILISLAIILIIGITIGHANKETEIPEKEDTEENIQQEAENEEEAKNIEVPIEKQEKEEDELLEQKEEINTLKENTGKTGDTDLYEIQEGDNNIKIATIKSSIKYKVAFAGMAENQLPTMDKIDNVLQEDHPKYAGIWIYEDDRENVLGMIKEITNSEYKIDENGYLKIVNKNNQNENDKKLENIIKGEKLYIIRNSSICYIVDEVTGEILDYNFEKLDRYQTYEYFQDDDKMIIFMNENTKQQMTSKEIIQSVIDLL